MRYLFGDSSESNLEINYLAFLRDTIDFAVEVLQATARVTTGQQRRGERERAAEEAAGAIEKLGRAIAQVTDPLTDGDAPVNKCALSIAAAATEIVKREVARVRAGLGSELQQTEEELVRLRSRTTATLGTLVATHDLPDATEASSLRWTGVIYEARLRQTSEFGLEVMLGLEVPSSSLFAHDLRVDKVMEAFEVHAPETAGWLKKEVKMAAHKVGRHHISEVTSGREGVTVRLRATPDPGATGYEVTVDAGGRVGLRKVSANGEAEPAFDTDERDVAPLRHLATKLDEGLSALRTHRGPLVSASLDGEPLTKLAEPRTLVERLIQAIAPVVREIAMHSQSPHELVLRRLLGGNRREEIFLPRAELLDKINTLPADQRRVFTPLGFFDEPTSQSTTAPVVVASAPVIAAPPPEPPAIIVAPPPPAPEPPPVVAAPLPPEPAPVAVPPASASASAPAPAPVEDGAIEMEADLPPLRPPSPMNAPLPRLPRKTAPPPATAPSPAVPAPPTLPAEATVVAAVEAALRDLEDQEPTEVVRTPPRPPR